MILICGQVDREAVSLCPIFRCPVFAAPVEQCAQHYSLADNLTVMFAAPVEQCAQHQPVCAYSLADNLTVEK